MTTEQEALEHIRSTYPDLERWSQRAETAFHAAPGSKLAADDEDWKVLPTSQLVFGALSAAGDHLKAIRAHLDARTLFPFAQRTLIRTATLSAAQAVWVLAPDDATKRLQRSRIVRAEIYEQHLKYLNDLAVLAAGNDPNTTSLVDHIRRRRDEHEALRATTGDAGRFNATGIVQQAAAAALGSQAEVEARSEWRAGSGAAHGLLWVAFNRPGTQQSGPAADGGLADFAVAGSLSDIVNGYLLAWHLTGRGWRLLDQRSAPVD
ncbi:hypothetical protein [Actinopolymorpha pittospori]|uniref:Uncharacterized protein n=1 Tax=Actinopolymorpha pittospori TaxID=648752 RepID=A0A927MW33_9ACTN|nr:hypothetical protein [Actinopolymorpha pittospori]MBE1606338.1 hypothetical protein [Actinopolymorpha pittospori]